MARGPSPASINPPTYRQVTLRRRFYGVSEDDMTSFKSGMVRDEPQHLIPPDAVWDAKDVFINVDGALTKRGGSKVIQSAGSTFGMQQNGVGILSSSGIDGLVTGYLLNGTGGQTNATFIPGSGTTAITTLNSGFTLFDTIGVPFQHLNLLVVPCTSSSALGNYMAFMGGSRTKVTNSLSFYAITAGQNRITGVSGADIANCETGMLMQVANGTTQRGVYRITAVGASTLDIEPTPTISIAAGTTTVGPGLNFNVNSGFPFPQASSAACGCSFQNRILIGAVESQAYTAGPYQREGSLIAWSPLPTEVGGAVIGGCTFDGWAALTTGAFYKGSTYNNYLYVTGVDKIRALVPIDQDNMFILGSRGSAMLTGALSSELSTTRSLSYAVRSIQQGLGCMSQASVQKTSAGVVYASSDGICLFDGRRVHNIMDGRIAQYWQGLVAAGLTINGSAALTPATYYISTSAGGFLCSLDGFRWTRTTGIGIWGSVADPSSDQRTYAILNNSTGSSLTYKLHRIDTYLNPDSTVQNDADGTAVLPSVTTRTVTDGDATALKRLKHVKVELQTNGATTTVQVNQNIDGSGTVQTLGTVLTGANPQPARFEPPNMVLDEGWSYTISTASALTNWNLFGIFSEMRRLFRRRTS